MTVPVLCLLVPQVASICYHFRMMRIAVVEDEQKLAASLKEGLEAEGYLVDVFSDGRAALAALTVRGNDYALIVLDLLLPYRNGFDVCRTLRDESFTMPILILTARDSIEDKVRALDSGADDFLTKPFAFEELLARVRALVRRSQQFLPEKKMLGTLSVDLGSRLVSRNGKPISLTPTEFDLLASLISQNGQAVARQAISAHLWGLENTEFSNVVDVHISNLRKKIEDGTTETTIRTVRGMGYAIHS